MMTESDYEYLDRLYEQIDELQSQVVSLHKALDKACDMLRLFESAYAESESAYALISSTLDGVECHDIEWWKEWCMKDV